jgi:PAS domain S-box-containing protein
LNRVNKYQQQKIAIKLIVVFLVFLVLESIIYTFVQKKYNTDIVVFKALFFIFLLLIITAYSLYRGVLKNNYKLKTIIKEKEIVIESASSVINALPANIAILDRFGYIIDVNDSWKLFADENDFVGNNYGIGTNYIEASEKTYYNMKEGGSEVALAIKNIIKGESNHFSTIYSCDSPTKKRWFRVIVSKVDKLNNFKIILMHIDITEKEVAEEKVKQSEANLSQIIDLVPHLIFVKDQTGKFIKVNKRFAEFYGLQSSEHLNNKNILESIPIKAEGEKFMLEDAEIISSGKSKIIAETHFTDFKGQEHLLYTTKVPYTQDGTNDKAILGVAIDITEQKLAELEKNKITNDLIQRSKIIEQFNYIISHNLRAPIANILGLANVLKLNISEIEKKQIENFLFLSVDQLDNTVKDLSKILQVKSEINEYKQNVSFHDLIDEIKLSIRNIIEKENVKIEVDFEMIDQLFTIKSYIHSVFLNLITNSIKYRQLNGKPIIRIKTEVANDKVIISIKDNGLGINLQEHGDKIFGLYKRFHLNIEGKGLGLFLVKTQIESMGGNIHVKSEVNSGSEFIIELPKH